MSRTRLLCGCLMLFWTLPPSRVLAVDPPNFSRDILPILSDNCFHCHGPDAKSREADLRLDQSDSALRVKNPVIIPGRSADSELLKRIRSKDPDTLMPPLKSGRKLTAAQVELLQQWIDAGAKWGQHWAFEPIRRPDVPQVAARNLAGAPPRNPIDAFIWSRLEKEGLAPAPEASKETLIRRATLDLTGLPPTLAEIDAFLADQSPDAYEQVVDRLLKSPRFGERMVWEWLDAARYADTNGYQGDPTRTMYFWRDWAIDALNNNMPFDQFTIEQLAGDQLPNPTQRQLIATGFHRNHMINGEGGRIAEESRVDYVQDRVETTGTVWMGLTFNCCRCHDHKFDPISQKEYYQLSAFFNSIEETGGNDAGGLANPIISLATPEGLKKIAEAKSLEDAANKERAAAEMLVRESHGAWLSAARGGLTAKDKPASKTPLTDRVRELLAIEPNQLNDAQKKELLDFHLNSDATVAAARKKADDAKKAREATERSQPRTMVMRERQQPRDTFILVRGAYDKYADKVSHGLPAVLPPPAEPVTNRLALARWLMSPDHPLTARVTVNRFWQTFFGTGLVKTTEDFGVQGEKPSHPELLDWLAAEFMAKAESGKRKADETTSPLSAFGSPLSSTSWDVKHLLRLIVTSATYRQSSKLTPALLARDPDNRLLARGPRYRLPSWMIRDQALAVGGLLVEKQGGPPVKGYQPPGIWEEATFGRIAYQQDQGESLYRRSLYQFWRRIVGPTIFFDVAARQTCQVKVARTNTPLHALVTLNDVTFVEAARALAQRVLLGPGPDDSARLTEAFRLCTSRRPTSTELALLTKRLHSLRTVFATDETAAKQLLSVGQSKPHQQLAPDNLAAMTSLCTLLLNLDETISKE